MKISTVIKLGLIIPLGLSLNTCKAIRQPWKTSFEYYDKNFCLPQNTKLKTSGSYLLVTGTFSEGGEKAPLCDFLTFREDGVVKLCVTFCNVEHAFLSNTCDDIFGYYKILGDSIFFTTKSFYRHKPNYYYGIVKENSLLLTLKSGSTHKTFTDEYRYCDHRFPCSDQNLY